MVCAMVMRCRRQARLVHRCASQWGCVIVVVGEGAVTSMPDAVAAVVAGDGGVVTAVVPCRCQRPSCSSAAANCAAPNGYYSNLLSAIIHQWHRLIQAQVVVVTERVA